MRLTITEKIVRVYSLWGEIILLPDVMLFTSIFICPFVRNKVKSLKKQRTKYGQNGGQMADKWKKSVAMFVRSVAVKTLVRTNSLLYGQIEDKHFSVICPR